MQLTSKMIYIYICIYETNIKYTECTQIFHICEKKRIIQRKKYDDTFTHGSKRGGMTSCIVKYLNTVFVNTYTYLKQCMSCFLNA